MNRYAIQDRMILQWNESMETENAFRALSAAQHCENSAAVDVSWRWLADFLTILYNTKPEIGAACCSWCYGWLHGASSQYYKGSK